MSFLKLTCHWRDKKFLMLIFSVYSAITHVVYFPKMIFWKLTFKEGINLNVSSVSCKWRQNKVQKDVKTHFSFSVMSLASVFQKSLFINLAHWHPALEIQRKNVLIDKTHCASCSSKPFWSALYFCLDWQFWNLSSLIFFIEKILSHTSFL